MDESCITETSKKSSGNQEEAMRPRNLQLPNATNKLRGIGIVNQNAPQGLMPIKSKVQVDYSLEEANKIANAIVMQINTMAG